MKGFDEAVKYMKVWNSVRIVRILDKYAPKPDQGND